MVKRPIFILATYLLLFSGYAYSASVCTINIIEVNKFCKLGCAWENTTIWTCVPAVENSFPSNAQTDANLASLELYMINVTANTTAPLSSTNLPLGYVTVGAAATGSSLLFQTLSVSGTSFTPSSLTVQNHGIVYMDVDTDTFGGSNGSPITVLGGLFYWLSGTLVSDTIYPFNVSSGTLQLMGYGAKQTNRNIISTGTLSLHDGTYFTVNTGATVTINSPGTLSLIGNVTITTPVGGKVVCYGGLTISPGLHTTATLNVNFITNQTINTGVGSLIIGANATLGNVINAATAQITFITQTLVTGSVTNNGFLYWTSGKCSWNQNATWINTNIMVLSGTNFQYIGTDVGTLTNTNLLTLNNSVTFRAIDIINTGSSAVLEVDSSFSSSSLSLFGGQVIGAGSIDVVSGTFEWTSGTVAVPITIGSKVIAAYINGTDEKIINNVAFSVGTSSTIIGNVAMIQGDDVTVIPSLINTGSMNAAGASVYMKNVEQYGELVNNGVLYGTLTLKNGVDLYNNAQIGTTASPNNPNSQITITGGGLYLGPNSIIYLDIWDGSKGQIVVSGNFTQAGKLIVRLRNDFIAYSGTTINVLTYSTVANMMSGSFAADPNSLIDVSDWSNAGNCQGVGITHNTKTATYVLYFSGCGAAPSPAVEVHTSNNGTIVAVVLVVFFVVVIAGTIAWCKKKYRKRPWDRLRRDRL